MALCGHPWLFLRFSLCGCQFHCRMAYGERIKRLRTGRELTQEQLAEKINVSRTYIVKIENGLQIGPIEIAIELAMFFDVSMDFLLLGKENYRVDRKQCLRMAIDILSELQAKL